MNTATGAIKDPDANVDDEGETHPKGPLCACGQSAQNARWPNGRGIASASPEDPILMRRGHRTHREHLVVGPSMAVPVS
jgi:hypothetical protein